MEEVNFVVKMFSLCGFVLTMYGAIMDDRKEPEPSVEPSAETRTERVDLRLTPSAKRTLQRAAVASRKSMTEFVVDSALAAAFDMLADRRVFPVDDAQWAAFVAALDAPVADNPALRALLARRPAWER